MVLRKKDARDLSRCALVAIAGSNRIHENRFIVPARADGENDLASHHIRNSISLTMRRARRMICVSHQRGATNAGGIILSQRSSVRTMRNVKRCAKGGVVPAQAWGLMYKADKRAVRRI